MAALAVLGGVLVLALLVAWLSDRSDAKGGAQRIRSPRAIGSKVRAARKEARRRARFGHDGRPPR